MMIIGPISSIYDFLTFAVLLWVFHASTNESLFHTGWFVESLATQTLVVFVIRTAANPLKSRAQSAVADQRVGRRCCRGCAAVHATREVAAVYSATPIIVGRDCVSCGDLSLSRAGR